MNVSVSNNVYTSNTDYFVIKTDGHKIKYISYKSLCIIPSESKRLGEELKPSDALMENLSEIKFKIDFNAEENLEKRMEKAFVFLMQCNK